MNKIWQLAVAAGSCGAFTIATLIHAALAASTIPISVTFRDAYPLSSGDQIGGDQIGNNGVIPYVTQGAVVAEFDASGNLHLNTDLQGRKGGRTLALAFQDPVPGTSCSGCSPPPFTAPTLRVAFMSTNGVFDNGNNVGGLLQMTPGDSGTTNLNVDIAGWFIRFNPGAYPQSTQVSVTRIDEKNWKIETISTSEAGLVKLSNNGNTQTNVGRFFMPTQILINCPTC